MRRQSGVEKEGEEATQVWPVWKVWGKALYSALFLKAWPVTTASKSP